MPAYRVSSGYGPRRAPLPGGSTYHVGVDVAAPVGTPVHAAASGTVTRSEHNTVRGNVVVIDHGGWTTLYQHLHTRDVGRGARVDAGQQIGTIGATGLATGPHLHLEERHAGVLRDPAHLVTAVMEGTDMPTLAEITQAVKAAIPSPWSAMFGPADDRVSAGTMLSETRRDASLARRDAAAALAVARELARRGPGMDEADVDRIVTEAASRIKIHVTVEPED